MSHIAEELPVYSGYNMLSHGKYSVKRLDSTAWRTLTKFAAANKYDAAAFRLLCRTVAHECFLAYAWLATGEELLIRPFHELMAWAFEDIAAGRLQRLIVSMPPRAGKSFLMSLFVSWLIYRDPTSQHILASYGQMLSGRFARAVFGYLKNESLWSIFKGRTKWQGMDGKFSVIGGASVLATSVGGPLTGFAAGTPSVNSPGVGLLAIDDPLKSSRSVKQMQNVASWFSEEASTRRTGRWAQLLIATRFSKADLHGHIMATDGLQCNGNEHGWVWLNIKAICEDPETDPLEREAGESLWPTNPIFSLTMLEAQRLTMGSSAFAALYQGEPVSSEGAMVRESWLPIVERVPDATWRWMSLDTSYGETMNSDESSVTIWGATSERCWVKNQVNGKWDFPQLIRIVKTLATAELIQTIVIEKAASGTSLAQVLRTEVPSIKILLVPALKSKGARLQEIIPSLEQRKIHFLEGGYTQGLFDQLVSFPFTSHDDRMDSFVHGACYWIKNIKPRSSMERKLEAAQQQQLAKSPHAMKRQVAVDIKTTSTIPTARRRGKRDFKLHGGI